MPNHPLLRKNSPPHHHDYKAGWNASRTSKDYDLDKAETRYGKKHADSSNMFSAGWADYSADRPYGHALTQYDKDNAEGKS